MSNTMNHKNNEFEKLYNAFIYDDVDEFLQLIDQGVDVNCLSEYGLPLINRIFYCNNKNKVKKFFNLLVENGASINKVGNSENLINQVITSTNDTYYLKELLKRNSNPNDFGVFRIIDWHKYDPAIFEAINRRNYKAIKLLLKHNLDLNIENQYGDTPLNHLIYTYDEKNKQLTKIVKKFLSHGADPNIIGTFGEKAIHLAAKYSNDEKLLKVLYDNASIDINAREYNGETPLMLTAEKGNLKGTEFLVQKNANLEILSGNESSAISYSIANNHYDIFKFLLNKGASLLHINKKNNNILHKIAKYSLYKKSKHHKYFKKISKLHPELLDMKNCDGKTPPHILQERY